ncbi:MAG: FAD-dependent oxidoreductase [Solirubrobacteraceae bacterium]
MTDSPSQSLASSPERRSIAIVGGGIAGLYAAYMLGRLGQDVQVFEVSSDHWGGRIESCSFDLGDGHAFIAEFGPMRFETDLQQRLRSLCFHLGIDFEPFSPTSAPIGTTHYDLTEEEESLKSVAQLLEWAVLRMFFERNAAVKGKLAKLKNDGGGCVGPLQFLELKRYMDGNYFCDVTTVKGKAKVTALPDDEIDRRLDALRDNATLRGEKGATKLAELGLWNALSEVITPGALARIRDSGTFYHFIADNPSALEWGIFWLRQASVMGGLSHFSRATAPHGTQELANKLEARIKAECSETVLLSLGHEVTKIEHGKRSDEVVLHIRCADDEQGAYEFEQRADHVVLAIPQQPLQRLSENFPASICERVAAVAPLPLLKAFLVTQKPWWHHHLKAQSYAWLVPTRELHYFRPVVPECPQLRDPPGKGCTCAKALKPEVAKHGMIMLYTDQPAISYWQALMTPLQRSDTVWHQYERGSEACNEVRTKPDGLLASLIRRLVLIPDPGLARKINLENVKIMEDLGECNAALAKRVEDTPSPTLGLAEQIFTVTKDRKAREIIEPVLKRAGVILDSEWRQWLAKAIDYKESDDPTERTKRTIEGAKQIRAWGIRDWSAPPFGGAAHVWLPRDPDAAATGRKADDPLVAFSLRGRANARYARNVHICGEAYSGFQGFIEGALRTAEDVVQTIVANDDGRRLLSDDKALQAKERVWKGKQSERLTEDWNKLDGIIKENCDTQ